MKFPLTIDSIHNNYEIFYKEKLFPTFDYTKLIDSQKLIFKLNSFFGDKIFPKSGFTRIIMNMVLIIPCLCQLLLVNIFQDFKTLRSELVKYSPELQDKSYMVVLSKGDLLDKELEREYILEMKRVFKNIPHLIISSITKYKLTELKDELWKILKKEYV